jgi:hypothetical protein
MSGTTRERELALAVIDAQHGEYAPANVSHELAVVLRDLADDEPTYGLELFERRALELINAIERSLAPRHDGQLVIYEANAILQLGDGNSVKLGDLADPRQLDRAHAVRSRQHAGQVVAYAAWAASYIEWRQAMVDTGLPLREAITPEVEEE